MMLAIVPGISNATGSFDNCSVIDIRFGTDPRNGHAQLNCEITGLPSCATATTFIAYDRESNSGKQYLAILTASLAANLKIKGSTHDSCAVWQPNVATLRTLTVSR